MKKIIFLTITIFTLFLFGCSGVNQGGRQVQGPELPKVTKAEEAKFDIYIDGTASMSGYVNFPNETVYAESVKGIERVITGTWKKDSIKYIKFGDAFTPLDRNGFLKFNQPDFYNQADTSLQNVVNKFADDSVSILITDLFQTNQDIDSLLIAIKSKCFSKDKALAIIGMRSQFNGTIYDVGKNLDSFSYASGTGKESYRPFYFLVVGNEPDVRSFVLAYKKFNSSIQPRVCMLSKNLGVNNTLETDKIHTLTGKDNPMAEINTLLANNSGIKQYRLKDKPSRVNLFLLAHDVLSFPGDKMAINVEKVERWSTGAAASGGFFDKLMNKNKNTNGSFEVIKADKFFTGKIVSSGLSNEAENVGLELMVDPVAIKHSQGKYRVKFAIVPDKEEYLHNINVFKDWDFDDTNISGGNLEKYGNKTLRINRFVNLVGNMSYELLQPGFNDLYVYFEAV